MNETKQTKDVREYRRLRAWELKQQGWKQKDIAEARGVTPGAVSQWMKRAREGGGREALRRRPAPGAAPRLSETQKGKIPAMLAKGAEAYGFRGEVWTRKRVAAVIRREFGVTYSPGHVGRILKAWGWSLQKPAERAAQRDEEAIQEWVEEEWLQLKKRR
jgi:transposase